MKTTPCTVDNQSAQIDYPYFYSPRCGAKTRNNSPCKSPAVKGKQRCRMHGGATGSGAPLENQNALKQGHTTMTAKIKRRYIKTLLSDCQALIDNNM